MNRNKNNKKNIRGNGLKRIKRGVVFGSLILVGMTVFVNSSLFTGNTENVYSQMKSKYGFNVEQVVMAEESSEQTQEQVVIETSVKNYNVSTEMDVRMPSNVTVEDLEKMLAGTKLSGLGQAFVDAEKTYGVNALYMMTCCRREWLWYI